MEEKIYWFIFNDDRLLLEKRTDNSYTIPLNKTFPIDASSEYITYDITPLQDIPCKAISLKEPYTEDSRQYTYIDLRASYDVLPFELYQKAGKAFEILHWDENSQYCSRCGAPMQIKSPISKSCTKCKHEVWPVVSTAIIVRITRGEEILLVRAKNFRGTFHGLVAGFLETGETLEECVKREVMEETGLQIKNIRYFDSQPWPYPNNLMVGFTAEYESGEIELQDNELLEAGFYKYDSLPEIPRKLSMARMLIDNWINNISSK